MALDREGQRDHGPEGMSYHDGPIEAVVVEHVCEIVAVRLERAMRDMPERSPRCGVRRWAGN